MNVCISLVFLKTRVYAPLLRVCRFCPPQRAWALYMYDMQSNETVVTGILVFDASNPLPSENSLSSWSSCSSRRKSSFIIIGNWRLENIWKPLVATVEKVWSETTRIDYWSLCKSQASHPLRFGRDPDQVICLALFDVCLYMVCMCEP